MMVDYSAMLRDHGETREAFEQKLDFCKGMGYRCLSSESEFPRRRLPSLWVPCGELPWERYVSELCFSWHRQLMIKIFIFFFCHRRAAALAYPMLLIILRRMLLSSHVDLMASAFASLPSASSIRRQVTDILLTFRIGDHRPLHIVRRRRHLMMQSEMC
ncbi:hypothetical protein EJ06DRAFT_406278 [Trichodelitschia bisporula]|uniref:Uncharacterized protein n=1 Tax=Trichodelitschia bisporula TaxID=703511 RepID=A0A6G1HYH0_9PEZI|nr:hypothetical protein EJ06DRAFT_406278 [Trichodelitschia bisporula]